MLYCPGQVQSRGIENSAIEELVLLNTLPIPERKENRKNADRIRCSAVCRSYDTDLHKWINQ